MKTQIWTAVCVYVLAAIVKKELALDVALYTFLQILSVVCPFLRENPHFAGVFGRRSQPYRHHID